MTIRRSEFANLDLSDVTTGERLAPVPPGDVLRHQFMDHLNLSARTLARQLGIPANRVTSILNGSRRITAETAVLLERRFGASAEFWLGLQTAHDLELARTAQKEKI